MRHGMLSAVMLSALAIASCSVLSPGSVAAPETSRKPSPQTGMARLTFERSPEGRATACPALVYVDGTLRARLGAAQSATIPVRAGFLDARVKLGKFCGTIHDQIFSLRAAPAAEYRFLIGIADVPEN